MTPQKALPEELPKAVIYLRLEGERINPSEWDRLVDLRRFAAERRLKVTQIVGAQDDGESPELPVAYQEIRQRLIDGKTDAIVLWHLDLDRPDILVRADLVR